MFGFETSMSAPYITPTSTEIRKRGLKMLAGGGLVFAAILFLMHWLSAHNYRFQFAVIGASLPFVFVCVGVIELVTGSPYLRLAQNGWGCEDGSVVCSAHLSLWQRLSLLFSESRSL
jgi:hypothetical protein